ncbi:MAG TPA: hypothetical protein VHN16_04710 [Streptosporangiaceae bacterium]|nr:hypothetical protein [Streptosporangiaceae bacterium]
MAKHTGARRRESGFKRFLRRLFSVRTGGILGSAASVAEPLHVESAPSRPRRNSARK